MAHNAYSGQSQHPDQTVEALLNSAHFSNAITFGGIIAAVEDFQRSFASVAVTFSEALAPLQAWETTLQAVWHSQAADLAELTVALDSLAMRVGAEPSQGVESSLIGLQTRGHDPVSLKAQTAMAEFREFYATLVDEYARALAQAGKATDRKLEYARDPGAARLAGLQSRLSVTTTQQLTQLRRVVRGLRQIAASTTETPERGSLLVRIVGDLERRLTRLHLAQSAFPVAPAASVKANVSTSALAFAA